MSLHWIDDADHWICPCCGFETGSPAKYEGCKCPKCGFQDDKDKAESEEGMIKEEAIKRLKEARNTIQPFRYVDEAIDYAIKALEQEPCEDKRLYIKVFADLEPDDIAEKIYQICDEDKFPKVIESLKEYFDSEPCEDCVSRQAVKEQMIKYGFHAPDMTVTEFVEGLPPVNPQLKTVTNAKEAEAYPISEELQWFDIA